eukprot:SAG31_NODE_1745_length_7379_cov_8.772115_8_plen_139_part_00
MFEPAGGQIFVAHAGTNERNQSLVFDHLRESCFELGLHAVSGCAGGAVSFRMALAALIDADGHAGRAVSLLEDGGSEDTDAAETTDQSVNDEIEGDDAGSPITGFDELDFEDPEEDQVSGNSAQTMKFAHSSNHDCIC